MILLALKRQLGRKPQQNQSGKHSTEPEKPDLSVLQLQQLCKQAPPSAGRQKGQQALDHKNQGQRRQQIDGIQDLLLARRGSGRRAGSTHDLEELGRRIQDHDIALLRESRLVGIQAAIELGKLRVSAEGVTERARRLGVAIALDLLGFAIGVGDRDLALAIGVSPDLLAFGGTL